jgi:hypothetical protein
VGDLSTALDTGVIAGIPASAAIVVIVWGLTRIGLNRSSAPAAAIGVGVILAVAMHGPYPYARVVVEAIVTGLAWAVVAVGGHSAVTHTWEVLIDGHEPESTSGDV